MVKGIHRRVILVRTPDPRLFDEAIFIVRDGAAEEGVSSKELLQEAQAVANDYIQRNRTKKKRRRFRWLSPALCFSLGAGLTGAAWGLSLLL